MSKSFPMRSFPLRGMPTLIEYTYTWIYSLCGEQYQQNFTGPEIYRPILPSGWGYRSTGKWRCPKCRFKKSYMGNVVRKIR